MHCGVLAARRVLAIRHFCARSRAREQSYQRLYDSIFIGLTFLPTLRARADEVIE
jgi:hypothetical protein